MDKQQAVWRPGCKIGGQAAAKIVKSPRIVVPAGKPA